MAFPTAIPSSPHAGSAGREGTVRLIPLGGLGEVGMNCLAIEQRGEVLVVDCGVTFDGRGLGVDVVHPDFSALDAYRVAGLFLTHGHEDHIGAIPYFLKRFDAPVFGPRYALGLVRSRAAEHEILDHGQFYEVTPGQRVRVGTFEVEPIRVTHSIADATALAITTDVGVVVHSGDFKFDPAPADGEHFDVARFEQLAGEGVRLLLSDSTNVDAAGPTGSEEDVARALDDVVARAPRAVIVGIFASNVHRLSALGDIARRRGRKLVALGRSVATHARVARSVARAVGSHAGEPYLDWPSDLVWPADRVSELPPHAILGVATGTQGEEAAALSRLARGEHPALQLAEGDVVVLSSRVIPGNEAAVMQVMANLLRRGVHLTTWWSNRRVHVSGHAHREEQRRLIDLVRPRAFVPVHGTLHHLRRHADLAREAGVDQVTVLENGDVGEVDGAGVRHVGRVHVGRVHVFAQRTLPANVLAERAALAARGVAHVVVPVDGHGRLAGDIVLVTRGVADDVLDAPTLAAARHEAADAVDQLAESAQGGLLDEPAIGAAARQGVRRALGRVLGFKPITTATVLRVRG